MHLEIDFKRKNKSYIAMGVTQLKRKSRRNRAIANNKIASIKQLSLKPMIKKVDVETLKQEFAK